MFNMYREPEKEPKYKKNLIGDIKLAFRTSQFNRNRLIKKITKSIVTVDYKDTETLNKFQEWINRLDLTDSRYGKTLSTDVVKLLNSKLDQNKKYVEKIDSANAEIETIKALYNPNKVGTVEVYTREEPRVNNGGKPIDPDVYTTTVIHTEHGPLVREVMTNNYKHALNPYCVIYKGFVKQNDEIVYIRQQADCVRSVHWDYDPVVFHEEFVKSKDGKMDLAENRESFYGGDLPKVECSVTAYFEEQLQKCQDKSSDKQ